MKLGEPVVLYRNKATGCWTVLWAGGCLQNSLSSQTWLCSKCFCGWCCLVCSLNWSLVCLSSSSPSSTGCMKDFVAQRPVNLENWALILSSIQIASLCWDLSQQSSWRERWDTDLWLTDEMLFAHLYQIINSLFSFQDASFMQESTVVWNCNISLLLHVCIKCKFCPLTHYLHSNGV